MNDQIYKNWRKDVGTDYETTRRLVDEDYTRANISRNTEDELVEMNKKLTGATAMNERIKQLEIQCWEPRQYGPAWFDSKKFAELIVRECAQTLIDNTPERYTNESAEEDWDKGYDRAMKDCVHLIREHFGVE